MVEVGEETNIKTNGVPLQVKILSTCYAVWERLAIHCNDLTPDGPQ